MAESKKFRPRVSETKREKIKEIKREIALLTTEMNAPDEQHSAFEREISFDEVRDALEKENANMREYIDYQMKKNEKLKNEKESFQCLKEEESIIASTTDYIKNTSFVMTESLDEKSELYFKLEVLHRKLCLLLKKFLYSYFNGENPDLVQVSETSDLIDKLKSDTTSKSKSILDIFKLLLPELNLENNSERSEPQEISIDDSMPEEYIEFLLSANIIERCLDNPQRIKLSDGIANWKAD